jgi:hypothetical protein
MPFWDQDAHIRDKGILGHLGRLRTATVTLRWSGPDLRLASARGVTYKSANRAEVAELADAPASGAGARKGVEVQVLSSALIFSQA